MPKAPTNPKVDFFIERAEAWSAEMAALRQIALGAGLAEEMKWGKPCYTLEGSNLAIIVGFKAYCALMFTKGVLLKDAKKLLVAAGENSQSARQMRFTSLAEITKLTPTLKAYLKEAIAAEKAGVKVQFKQPSDFTPVTELKNRLARNPAFKAAFEALTPGRQRAYNLHFAGAKQTETRESRIDKCTPLILRGKGLNDDYIARTKKK